MHRKMGWLFYPVTKFNRVIPFEYLVKGFDGIIINSFFKIQFFCSVHSTIIENLVTLN